jgi:phosphatidylinositol alpha 1,6-mannosyltransferase
MDLFLFPSRTDTFGNVIQEAAASGVPSIVTSEGGPRNLVVHGVTGFIADDDRQFIDYVLELVRQPELLRRMARNARDNVLDASWDAAFEMTYAAYRYCKQKQIAPAPYRRPRFPAMPSVPAA